MKIRFASERRATWRLRFVEIARQVQGPEAVPAPLAGHGLRARSRQSGFAAWRRARPGGMRLA